MYLQPLLTRVSCGALSENAYLYGAPKGETAVLIDPGDDLPALRRAIEASGRRLGAILLTHGHFDHVLAAEPLQGEYNCPVYIHPLDADMLFSQEKSAYNAAVSVLPPPTALRAEAYPAEDGGSFALCGIELTLLHTPGHTPGAVCLLDRERGLLFSGDTLFQMGMGRTDLPGGDENQIRASLKGLSALPDNTAVLPGHGPYTRIAHEKRWMGAEA